MNILGIGPTELILIVVIMLVVWGPKDMVTRAGDASRMIRKVIKSDTWRSMMDTTREIRSIPTKLAKESGLDEDLKEIRRQTRITPIDLGNLKVDTTKKPPSTNAKANGKTEAAAKEEKPEANVEAENSEASAAEATTSEPAAEPVVEATAETTAEAVAEAAVETTAENAPAVADELTAEPVETPAAEVEEKPIVDDPAI